jgi:hypothetical protein
MRRLGRQWNGSNTGRKAVLSLATPHKLSASELPPVRKPWGEGANAKTGPANACHDR